MKKTNEIIEDHGEWLLVDISTPKHSDATMAVDKYIFYNHIGGRISARSQPNTRYICATYFYKGRNYYFHREIMKPDNGLEVDHKSHGTESFIDNRKRNLRLVSSSQNKMNRRRGKNNTSGIVGVNWSRYYEQWVARIKVDGVEKTLGRDPNIEIAIGIRQQAERDYFGEYAYKKD
ncbi:MAG: hypothetical protein ACN2B6_11475 [Rickettsiales bacterium]